MKMVDQVTSIYSMSKEMVS